MSSAEKRSSPRQNVRCMGQVHDVQGLIITQCIMTDVSASGAKLVIMEAGINVPDSFVLTLAPNAGVLRHCAVAWRRANSIGVRFVAPPL